jgi:hypothetical protein
MWEIHVGKMAHITPYSNNKSNYLGRKVKVEHEPNNLKGSFLKPTRFTCPLYAKVLEIGDVSLIFHKEFVKIYGLSTKGMNPKRIRIPRNLTIEKVFKKNSPI